MVYSKYGTGWYREVKVGFEIGIEMPGKGKVLAILSQQEAIWKKLGQVKEGAIFFTYCGLCSLLLA